MPETILVIAEQREGKLNRVSWETLAAGQAIAAETGWTLEAAVVGDGVGSIANEIAGKKVAKVYAVESPALKPYTPDAFSAALKQFLTIQTAEISSDAPYLSGAGFYSAAGDRDGKDGHQRLHRFSQRW